MTPEPDPPELPSLTEIVTTEAEALTATAVVLVALPGSLTVTVGGETVWLLGAWVAEFSAQNVTPAPETPPTRAATAMAATTATGRLLAEEFSLAGVSAFGAYEFADGLAAYGFAFGSGAVWPATGASADTEGPAVDAASAGPATGVASAVDAAAAGDVAAVDAAAVDAGAAVDAAAACAAARFSAAVCGLAAPAAGRRGAVGSGVSVNGCSFQLL